MRLRMPLLPDMKLPPALFWRTYGGDHKQQADRGGELVLERLPDRHSPLRSTRAIGRCFITVILLLPGAQFCAVKTEIVEYVVE